MLREANERTEIFDLIGHTRASWLRNTFLILQSDESELAGRHCRRVAS